MKIAVCDDQEPFRKYLIGYLQQYAEEHGKQFFYFEYSSGEEMLSSKAEFDLIFVDYMMRDLNGVDTISLLREQNISTHVIFISSFPEAVFDTFSVNAFRFLIKPVEYAKLEEALNAYYREKEQQKTIVICNHRNSMFYNIPESEIIYAQADNICTYIITPNASLRYSYNLTSLENELQSDFFMRTHRTYLVNLHFIASYDHKVINLTNGHKALISRLKYKDFCNCYMTFIKNLRGFK